MTTVPSKTIYIEFAKLIQNNLLENGIDCFLIGGSLINTVRDNGVLLSDDIDFAITNEEDIDKILNISCTYAPTFTWTKNDFFISLHLSGDEKQKVDLFVYSRRYLNYYIKDISWMNEKIHSFQTFKPSKVILENKEFYTFYRPDIFLKGVYGDYMSPKDSYYPNLKGGDHLHATECVFYTSDSNYDIVDFQVENLKLFFKSVVVKRNCKDIDNKKINIFDSSRISVSDESKILIYKDFINYLIKNNIKYYDC
jgi:hypothetical protein